jgi:hypothetical protein
LVEIGLLVLEKKILKNFQCISTLFLLSPLEQGPSLSFEKFTIPSLYKDDLCQVWSKLAEQTDGTTDNRRSEKLT